MFEVDSRMDQVLGQNLLLSFCNLPVPRSTALLKIHLATESSEIVPLEEQPALEKCAGLATDEGNIYVLYQVDGVPYIAALVRDNFQLRFRHRLAQIEDGHSICVSNGYLYVVSTGTDQVVRYHLANGELGNSEVVWKATTSGKDTHHVNSIVEWNRHLVVSAFGQRTGELWSTAFNGYIHDITANVRVADGIYQPHSLCAADDNLYFCESRNGRFSSLHGSILDL